MATGAEFKHGLLTIDLVREVPEAFKPRRISIGRDQATGQDNARTQLDQKKAA